MQIFTSRLVLVASTFLAASEFCAGQDISPAHIVLRDSQRSVASIRVLSRSYQSGDPKRNQFSADVALAIERLKESEKQLELIANRALDDFKARFVNLIVYQNLAWRVGVPNMSFPNTIPADIKIQSRLQTVSIRKTGNPKGRPVAPSPTYQVCPEVPFENGDRAAVTFSTPIRPTRGGIPVPYFGMRDARGRQHTLGDLGVFAGDGKTHTILIQRVGNEGLAVLDGKLATLQMRPPVEELTPPIFMFFHMNDTSEVVIHSIEFSRAVERQ